MAYVFGSTFYRPSLDHQNTKVLQTNSTYLSWMLDPKSNLTYNNLNIVFKYAITQGRLIFCYLFTNLTLVQPPLISTTTTNTGTRTRFLYVDRVVLTGTSENQIQQLKDLIDNNPNQNCLVYYNNYYYIGSQRRTGTNNSNLISIPTNQKLIQCILDSTKLWRQIHKASASASYQNITNISTKITNLSTNESFCILNSYFQIWLDAGNYLFEQLYTENYSETTNAAGETVITADIRRLQKNVVVDSDYTTAMLVDFTA